MKEYDIVAIGGGPAGLTVGLYGGRYGLKTLIIEKQIIGGAMAISPLIENYPGMEPITGVDLAERFKRIRDKVRHTIPNSGRAQLRGSCGWLHWG